MSGPGRLDPPEGMSEDLASIWREVVATHPRPEAIVGARLEAYCVQVRHLRTAHEQIASGGLVVEDAAGRRVANPALAIAREATESLRRWGREFSRVPVPRRRRGPMFDATVTSVTAAEHLKDKREFSGPVEAVKTLAWLIDEAQRAGIEELQKAAFGTIPTYLKGCEALQITPASRPEAKPEGKKAPGRLQALRGGMAAGGAASAG